MAVPKHKKTPFRKSNKLLNQKLFLKNLNKTLYKNISLNSLNTFKITYKIKT